MQELQADPLRLGKYQTTRGLGPGLISFNNKSILSDFVRTIPVTEPGTNPAASLRHFEHSIQSKRIFRLYRCSSAVAEAMIVWRPFSPCLRRPTMSSQSTFCPRHMLPLHHWLPLTDKPKAASMVARAL